MKEKPVPDLQSEIAGQTVSQLGLTLGTGGREAMETIPTDNLEAYQAYLQGAYLFSSPSFSKALFLQSDEAEVT